MVVAVNTELLFMQKKYKIFLFLYNNCVKTNNINGDKMKENIEVINLVYKDSDMSIKSLTELLETLEEKQNKIKDTVSNILKGYERYYDRALKLLNDYDSDGKKENILKEMMAKMGVDKEVKKDNSDANIAQMLIKGIDMGVSDINNKLKKTKDNIDNEVMNLANDFLDFQKDNIKSLKKHM